MLTTNLIKIHAMMKKSHSRHYVNISASSIAVLHALLGRRGKNIAKQADMIALNAAYTDYLFLEAPSKGSLDPDCTYPKYD